MVGDDPSAVHPPSWANPINRPHENKVHNYDDEEYNENLHPTGNCTRCQLHGDARMRRLEEIRGEILYKLGLKQAPNVTVRELRKLPPLHNILGRYGLLDDEETDANDDRQSLADPDRMAGDMPRDEEPEFEDFYVNAEKSLSFAKNRKFL